MAPRDIGRYGHPRGVFMTRPPPPKRYGRVVRWQTSGGRAKCAPRMYFDIFRPRHGELESTPSGAMWLPETSAGTATHAAYLLRDHRHRDGTGAWCDGRPAEVVPRARQACIFIYFDPAAESSNQRRVWRHHDSPRHRPLRPPAGVFMTRLRPPRRYGRVIRW
jgi:hypothetical protein